MLRLAAIGLIYLCTTFGWLILGATIFQRTHGSDSSLRGHVVTSWGAPQVQKPPTASASDPAADGAGSRGQPARRDSLALPLVRSRVSVALDLRHRQKGLLWYSTYAVDFSGAYTFRNPRDSEQAIYFVLDFPARQAIYDDLSVRLDGVPLEVENIPGGLFARARLRPGQTATLQVGYRSHGLESWRYRFGDAATQVRDFELRTRTNFRDVDFPGGTLSPTEKHEVPRGSELVWRYRNLVSGYEIGLEMPQKPQPGPLAGRISLFAPVSLLFFFFVLFLVTTVQQIELHPMNYFFLAAAFFAFHLLLAYLVDHISIHLAFAIASVISIALVVSYLRLVVGMRFAAVVAGLSQLVYLVLFSYAFFFEGYTGLAITIGAVVTLFVAMQATGRIHWAEVFARDRPA